MFCKGRCVWHNPIEKPEDDFEEEEEEEEREDVEEPKPESGPQLLTSIAEDEGAFLLMLLNSVAKLA